MMFAISRDGLKCMRCEKKLKTFYARGTYAVVRHTIIVLCPACTREWTKLCRSFLKTP